MPRAFFCNTTAARAWRHPSAICATSTGDGLSFRDVFRFSSTMDMSSSWHANSTAMATVARTSLDGSTLSPGNAGPARAAAAAAQGVSQSKCSVASNLSRTLTTWLSYATLAKRGAATNGKVRAASNFEAGSLSRNSTTSGFDLARAETSTSAPLTTSRSRNTHTRPPCFCAALSLGDGITSNLRWAFLRPSKVLLKAQASTSSLYKFIFWSGVGAAASTYRACNSEDAEYSSPRSKSTA
mmetsp:Transcript_13130/g.40314  ORF Transcript_13130/g.40314 Transcript_13130/m.40314 type:complete len:240 (+) Transcript_13130:2729-3448(+)